MVVVVVVAGVAGAPVDVRLLRCGSLIIEIAAGGTKSSLRRDESSVTSIPPARASASAGVSRCAWCRAYSSKLLSQLLLSIECVPERASERKSR